MFASKIYELYQLCVFVVVHAGFHYINDNAQHSQCQNYYGNGNVCSIFGGLSKNMTQIVHL